MNIQRFQLFEREGKWLVESDRETTAQIIIFDTLYFVWKSSISAQVCHFQSRFTPIQLDRMFWPCHSVYIGSFPLCVYRNYIFWYSYTVAINIKCTRTTIIIMCLYSNATLDPNQLIVGHFRWTMGRIYWFL